MHFAKIQRIYDYTGNSDKKSIATQFKTEYNRVSKTLDELKESIDSNY